jgi:O-antigen/teichoic acid export membrane protein
MNLSGLAKQSSIYLIGDLVRRGLGFLLIPFYTRYLSPADYGTIELIDLFVMISTICIGLGALGDGMVRIAHEEKDSGRKARVIATAFAAAVALGILGMVLGGSLAGVLSVAVFGSSHYAGLIRAAFIAMAFGNLNELGLVYLRLQQRPVFVVVFSLFQLVATVGFNVYFIAWAKMGVWGFVSAKLVCTGAGAAVLLFVVAREVGWRPRWEFVPRISGFSGPLIVSSGSFFVMHFADRFFLNHYTNLSTVGVYALAYKFGFLVTYLVGQPFGSVWNVSVYGFVGKQEWREQFARVASYLFFLLTLAGVLLSVFCDRAIAFLASPAFAPAATLIPVVVIGYVFREIGDFFRSMLFINKKVMMFGRITVGCALLNLGLDWVLIPRYQALGAAWATALTWAVYMVACWLPAQQEHQLPFSMGSFARLGTLALSVIAIAPFLHRLPAMWQWGGGSAVIASYLTSIWLMGYFTSAERTQIIRHLTGGRSLLLAAAGRSR